MITNLDNFKLILKYPVQWGEMDAANHVNNLVYMRYMESARIAYFEKIKMDTTFTSGESAGPILAWQDCKYIYPLTYPDTAVVGIRTIEILKDRFKMEAVVFSEKHNRLAALSKQIIIPYNYKSLQKVELPESWIKHIELLEGHTFPTS